MMSNRINKISVSPIMMLNSKVKERELSGIHFYKTNLGLPKLKMDKKYFDKIVPKNMFNPYINPQGLDSLIDIYCSYINSINNIFGNENVAITQGASDAIIKVLYSICDLGDEILVLEPFFSDYKIYCEMLGINIKVVPYNNLKDIEFKINSKTRAILFSNPNNPDGQIINDESIKKILDVAKKYNLFVISDEVYSELVYTKEYRSLLKYDFSNLVVVDSASKKFNACGSRIGFVVTKNSEVIDSVIKLNDSKISISYIEQMGIANLFKDYQRIINNNRKIYAKRIKTICNLLDKNNIEYVKPEGGLSILVRLKDIDTTKYAYWLVESYTNNNKSLLITPAKEFFAGDKGNDKIRICLTMGDDTIYEIVNLLVDSYKKFKGVSHNG